MGIAQVREVKSRQGLVREVRHIWVGKQALAHQETAEEFDLEGALRSSKTTICLARELNAAIAYPGIHSLLCRWTEDATHSILKPVWRDLCDEAGVRLRWNGGEQYDELSNGSRAYLRGLKSVDQAQRYSRFRGLTLARVYWDQTEEGPRDVYLELGARLSQRGYPHAITISPNAVDHSHWIKDEFPDDNRHAPKRKYIFLSVHDNAHNLDAGVIERLERLYPPSHPKHRTMVLGIRGLNVIGVPVYKDAFSRELHVKPCAYDPRLPLEEGLDFGGHHPCIVWRQIHPLGQIRYLGGILGQDMYLEDFLPIVLRYRAQWFPEPVEIRTCCDPAGAHPSSQGVKSTAVGLLEQHGFAPRWRDDANSPAVRNAMIEAIAGHMRRRAADKSEGLVVAADDRWVRVGYEDIVVDRFIADGFEAGYVWSPHMVSVGRKKFRQPLKDKWYEHGCNCFAADTDVLTKTGWKPFPEVVLTDALATVDLATDTLEFAVPSRLIRQPYAGDLLHFGGRCGALVTPDHRMVVVPWTGDWSDRRLMVRAAQDVAHTDRVKLSVAHWRGSPVEWQELEGTRLAPRRQVDAGDWAEFLGWYLAEGSCNSCIRMPGHGYSVMVAQMPGPKRVLLEALLAKLPWRWFARPAGLQASSKQLWLTLRPLGDSSTKRVPRWILDAPPEIIRRFLIGAVLGDGSVAGQQRGYFTVSAGLADDVQELFVKLGRASRLRVVPAQAYDIRGHSGTNTKPQYHVWDRPADLACVRSGDGTSLIRLQHYEGEVYCATVPNGTLVVRRQGRPLVAGNCVEYLEYSFGAQPKVAVTPPARRSIQRQRFAPRRGRVIGSQRLGWLK